MYSMDPNTRKTDVSPGRCVAAIATVAAVVLTASGLFASHPLTARASGYDWLQFDGNAQHSGNNTMETAITPANVHTLTRLFQVSLPAVADGPPAYLSGVATANGTQDLLFLTTKDGQILARDAHTGAQLWSHQYGPNGCKINNGSSDCYTTSEPAVDPNRQYVYNYGLDGKAHKYAVGDGTEVMTGGWPETATLKGYTEKGSSDLTVATTGSGTNTVPYLYVTNGGYPGDAGDYQGHVTTINLNTGSQTIFNADCSNLTTHLTTQANNDCSAHQSAIWARAGVTYDAQTNCTYMSTGNGTFDPTHYTWGDTLFALNPDGTGQGNGNPLLTYTPTDFATLKANDADLGSTAPVILPPPAGSSVSHLGLQSDKAAKLRLLNLDTLSGGTGNTGGEIAITSVPQGGEVLTQPAVWTNSADGSAWTFVANDQGLSALKVTLGSGGQPGLSTMWQNTSGGTSPIIANNVLYYVGGGGLRALDPTTGNQLWADTSINSVHWQSPIVANGVLYTTDNNGKLTAYTLPATSTATATVAPATSTATNIAATSTATPAPSATATATRTTAPSATNPVATSTPTTTPSPTATGTTAPSATATSTGVPSRTATSSPVPATSTPTTAPSATATRTAASSATATATVSASTTVTTTATMTTTATVTTTATAPPPTSTGAATASPTSTATTTTTTAPSATATSNATATTTASATSASTAASTTTTAPPSATPYPTIVIPSATATARPPLTLTVRVHPRIVVSDHFLSVRVHTRPGATVSVTFQVPAATGQPASHVVVKPGAGHPASSRARHVSGRSAHNSHAGQPQRRASRGYAVTHSGVANAQGVYVTYFYVTYKSARPTLGLVSVTAHTRTRSAARHVYIVVLPPHSPRR